jgi:hypothetical protein
MKKAFDFLLDKVLRLIFLFERPKKIEDGYIYERDFLGITDYGKEEAEIFKPVTEKTNNDFDKIYNIKTSLYHISVINKLKYYIENGFWGLFSLVLYDDYSLDNDDFFKQPSIIVYLIIDSKNVRHIAIVESKVKHFELLAFYKEVDVSERSFKERKLVYSKQKGFISL